MDINKALAFEGPALVCLDNGAEIVIAGSGEARTYTPSVPAGTPPLARKTFAELYRTKKFAVPEKAPAAKGGKAAANQES